MLTIIIMLLSTYDDQRLLWPLNTVLLFWGEWQFPDGRSRITTPTDLSAPSKGEERLWNGTYRLPELGFTINQICHRSTWWLEYCSMIITYKELRRCPGPRLWILCHLLTLDGKLLAGLNAWICASGSVDIRTYMSIACLLMNSLTLTWSA